MEIICLILKILLGLIITLVGLIIVIVVLVLTLPIDYIVNFEKYEGIDLYSKLRVFYILTIIYHLKEGEDIIDFRILGRQVNKEHRGKKEVKEVFKESKKDLVQVEKRINEETSPFETKDIESKSLKDLVDIAPNDINEPKKMKLSDEKNEKNIRKEEKRKKQSFKQPQIKTLWEDIKKLWESEYRKEFIISIKKMVIGLFKAIRPRYFKFNIMIGGEDPAQTGEWLAVASLLYPLYSKYGRLEANFEDKGFWGEANVEGRIRLYRILKVLLIFVINKSVRNYVKIILNIRKEERNGISIK